MTFWTFFAYLVGGLLLLLLGVLVLDVILWVIAKVTMSCADGFRGWSNNRAARKWQKLEFELEEDDE